LPGKEGQKEGLLPRAQRAEKCEKTLAIKGDTSRKILEISRWEKAAKEVKIR